MSDNKTYRLNDDALKAIREMGRVFRKENGRDPGPDDSCAFDPDSKEAQPNTSASPLKESN
jgi:hypothetical protein